MPRVRPPSLTQAQRRAIVALAAAGFFAQCGGDTLLEDQIPNLSGSWTGNNTHYSLIYNGLRLTQALGDSTFSGWGSWETFYYGDTLRVTGVLSRGTVLMALEYDSAGAVRRATFSGAVTFSSLASMSGLEIFSADSSDGLYFIRCNNCITEFPLIARFPRLKPRLGISR